MIDEMFEGLHKVIDDFEKKARDNKKVLEVILNKSDGTGTVEVSLTKAECCNLKNAINRLMENKNA